MKPKFILILLFLFAAFLIPKETPALDYPTREIEWIIAFAPGSNTDQLSRVAAKFAEKHVGKPIVPVNKPGGGGMLGYSLVAAAKPDGYTIGHLSNRTIFGPLLVKGPTFNKESFRLIGRYAYGPHALIARKGGPYDLPLKELVKKAKEMPKKITIGATPSWGAPDCIRVIFEQEAGIELNPISFPGGGGEFVPALLGGHVDLLVGGGGDFAALYKAGRFNLLAMAAEERNPQYPEIPTFRELGFDVALSAEYWAGAPAKTPDPVIHFLAEAFGKACAGQDFKEAIIRIGSTPAWEGPEAATKIWERLDQINRRIIAKYNLKPQ